MSCQHNSSHWWFLWIGKMFTNLNCRLTLDRNFLLCLINGICWFENKTRECEERCHYVDTIKQINHKCQMRSNVSVVQMSQITHRWQLCSNVSTVQMSQMTYRWQMRSNVTAVQMSQITHRWQLCSNVSTVQMSQMTHRWQMCFAVTAVQMSQMTHRWQMCSNVTAAQMSQITHRWQLCSNVTAVQMSQMNHKVTDGLHGTDTETGTVPHISTHSVLERHTKLSVLASNLFVCPNLKLYCY